MHLTKIVKQQGERPNPILFASSAERERYDAWFAAGGEGARHLIAYKALSEDVDDTLGHTRLAIDGHTHVFTVRQRSPFKETLDYTTLQGSAWGEMARVWGAVLATHHARADQRFRREAYSTKSFPKQLGKLLDGQEGAFVDDVLAWSSFYAAVVQQDYAEFKQSNGVDDLSVSAQERRDNAGALASTATTTKSTQTISVTFVFLFLFSFSQITFIF